MDGLIRLNLGCGDKRWPGFINCDLHNPEADIKCDLRSLPFQDNYADEAHSIHVIEHFRHEEVKGVLKEWNRVLKPGGKLVLEFPCLNRIIGLIGVWYQYQELTPKHVLFLLNGLYGDIATGEGMQHYWCYCVEEMRGILTVAGFTDVTDGDPHYHMKIRDVRMEATKV